MCGGDRADPGTKFNNAEPTKGVSHVYLPPPPPLGRVWDVLAWIYTYLAPSYVLKRLLGRAHAGVNCTVAKFGKLTRLSTKQKTN